MGRGKGLGVRWCGWDGMGVGGRMGGGGFDTRFQGRYAGNSVINVKTMSGFVLDTQRSGHGESPRHSVARANNGSHSLRYGLYVGSYPLPHLRCSREADIP